MDRAIAARALPLRRLPRPRLDGMAVATGVSLVALVYLLVIPLVFQVITAFRGASLPFFVPSARWTLANFETIYSSGALLDTVWVTFQFLGGSLLVAGVVGALLAWLVARTDLPGRNLIYALVLVPLIVPTIIRSQAWLLMLAPDSGMLNQLLRALTFSSSTTGPVNPFGFPVFTFVQGLQGVTLFFILLVPVLENMDAALEEAARMSGASTLQTLRRITGPLLLPGALAAVLLTFILTLGSFEVPLVFGQGEGKSIFSLRIWNSLRAAHGGTPQYGEAAAYAVNFLVLTYGLFYLYSRLTSQSGKYAVVTGKGFRPVRLALGRWLTPALIFVGAYVALAAVLPLLALLWSSVTPYNTLFSVANLREQASLGAFEAAVRERQFWLALVNTVFVALASATIAVFIAAVTAWLVVRGPRNLATTALDLLATSSVAIPATAAALAFFVFYLLINRWVPLYGTIWLLVLAYAYRLSVSYRACVVGVIQINRELEEAAAVCGASRWTTFCRILLPLLRPMLAAVWIPLFLLGAQEFTLPAFLANPETRTLPVLIYTRFDQTAYQLFNPPVGAAMAVIYTALMFGATYALRGILTRRTAGGAAPGTPGGDGSALSGPWERA